MTEVNDMIFLSFYYTFLVKQMKITKRKISVEMSMKETEKKSDALARAFMRKHTSEFDVCF